VQNGSPAAPQTATDVVSTGLLLGLAILLIRWDGAIAPRPGGGPGAGDFLLLTQKKVTKEKGAPVRCRYLVASCGIPALLAKAGRLRNSRSIFATAHVSGRNLWGAQWAYSKLAQCSPTTPRLGCDCSAALRGPKIKSAVEDQWPTGTSAPGRGRVVVLSGVLAGMSRWKAPVW